MPGRTMPTPRRDPRRPTDRPGGAPPRPAEEPGIHSTRWGTTSRATQPSHGRGSVPSARRTPSTRSANVAHPTVAVSDLAHGRPRARLRSPDLKHGAPRSGQREASAPARSCGADQGCRRNGGRPRRPGSSSAVGPLPVSSGDRFGGWPSGQGATTITLPFIPLVADAVQAAVVGVRAGRGEGGRVGARPESKRSDPRRTRGPRPPRRAR